LAEIGSGTADTTYFKDSEIGPVPVDWHVVPLSSVALVKYGKARPRSKGGIPAIGSGGVYAWVSKPLIDFSTLVIGRKGTAGKVQLVKKPCWPSDTTFYLEWLAPVDTYFLFCYLTLNPLSGEHAKTTLPSLSRRDVEACPIPLPPLPEQRRIARVLSTVRRAIEATEAVIAATRELKRSLMHHLFTYGPVSLQEAERVPLKETEIGLVPEHWDMVRLGEVCEKPQYGLTASAVETPLRSQFVRITDIKDGNVNWNSVPFCECPENQLAKYKLQPDDVLVARIGATTGKSYLVKDYPSEAVFASYLIRLRCRSRLFPGFLSHFMNTEGYWKQIDAAKGGRLKQGVNIPVLRSLMLGLPSLDEQRCISERLTSLDSGIKTLHSHKQALEALFQSLLHNLMTGRVRV